MRGAPTRAEGIKRNHVYIYMHIHIDRSLEDKIGHKPNKTFARTAQLQRSISISLVKPGGKPATHAQSSEQRASIMMISTSAHEYNGF